MENTPVQILSCLDISIFSIVEIQQEKIEPKSEQQVANDVTSISEGSLPVSKEVVRGRAKFLEDLRKDFASIPTEQFDLARRTSNSTAGGQDFWSDESVSQFQSQGETELLVLEFSGGSYSRAYASSVQRLTQKGSRVTGEVVPGTKFNCGVRKNPHNNFVSISPKLDCQ